MVDVWNRGEVSDKDMSLLIEMHDYHGGDPAEFPEGHRKLMNGKSLFWWLVRQGRYEDAMSIDIGMINSCT